MRIAIDAMGGDHAPTVPVLGGLEALQHFDDFELVLVGDPELIDSELSDQAYPRERLSVVPAREIIGMGEPPVEAVRQKWDSSIVRSVGLQKSGEADAFISAGSTGAVLAASLLTLGTLPGVDRPAIGALLPTAAAHPTLMIDAGANIDSKAHQLVQFAHLGHIYVQDVEGRDSPRIGLLNIGEEAEKGGELTVEAYRLLKEEDGIDFVGNVEGREIITGVCDVIVCDGFVGNVVLKFYESVAEYIAKMVSRSVVDADVSIHLENMRHILDYTTYGGAPLLGVEGVTVVCHGDTPPRAIRNAVRVAIKSVESNMVDHLRRELSGLANARV